MAADTPGRIRPEKKTFEKVRPLVTLSLLAAAVALIALGLFRGDSGEVARKAVVICLECIGVG